MVRQPVPRIAFVILTWYSAGYIRACLDSVEHLRPAYEPVLYLVDNGSQDDTVAVINSFAQDHPQTRLVLLRNTQNLGTTVPRNAALRHLMAEAADRPAAQAAAGDAISGPAAAGQMTDNQAAGGFDYICILDSDTVINRPAIDRLVATLVNRPETLLAAPRMFNQAHQEQCSVKHFPTLLIKLLKGSPFRSWNQRGERLEQYPFMPDPAPFIESGAGGVPLSQDPADYPVDYAISACWLLKPAALHRPGLLDEKIFYAPEDVDYCARVWEAGFEVRLASGASIYHLTQRISKRKLFSKMNWRHLTGLVYYFGKHRYCCNARRIRATAGKSGNKENR